MYKRQGIDLTGEVEGNVASEEYKKKIFGQDWYLGETFDAEMCIRDSFCSVFPQPAAARHMAAARIATWTFFMIISFSCNRKENLRRK